MLTCADLLAGPAAECVEVIIRAANFERRVAPGEPGLAVCIRTYIHRTYTHIRTHMYITHIDIAVYIHTHNIPVAPGEPGLAVTAPLYICVCLHVYIYTYVYTASYYYMCPHTTIDVSLGDISVVMLLLYAAIVCAQAAREMYRV
jgi:hypothetical protein